MSWPTWWWEWVYKTGRAAPEPADGRGKTVRRDEVEGAPAPSRDGDAGARASFRFRPYARLRYDAPAGRTNERPLPSFAVYSTREDVSEFRGNGHENRSIRGHTAIIRPCILREEKASRILLIHKQNLYAHCHNALLKRYYYNVNIATVVTLYVWNVYTL